MNEFLLAACGFLLALTVVSTVCAAWFAHSARRATAKARSDAEHYLTQVKDAVCGVQETHNTLVQQFALQQQTLDRLQSETAARALGRSR